MIKALLIRDNLDVTLGDFFELCYTFIFNEINDKENIHCRSIESRTLNQLSVTMIAEQMYESPYLFASFTHGAPKQLLKSATEPFIEVGVNHSILSNSFAYCLACQAGTELGRTIVEDGGLCFVGYKNDFIIHTGYKNVFAECAVSGFKAFLNNGTIKESVDIMLDTYTHYIDELYMDNFFIASVLNADRDAVVIHGNSDLKIDDFVLNN